MITKFKLYENNNSNLFKNESMLKDLLMKEEDFSKGEVHDSLLDVIHNEWQKNKDWNYDKVLEWTSKNLGNIPLIAMYLAKYNYQVGNGGHMQYYDNGYASSTSNGFSSKYKDTEKHEKFIKLFEELELDKILPSGKKALYIMSQFDSDLLSGGGDDSSYNRSYNYGYDDEDDEEEEEMDYSGLESLDEQWYEINDDVMEEFEKYLKSLTLDGEKISDLIKKVEHLHTSKKFNL